MKTSNKRKIFSQKNCESSHSSTKKWPIRSAGTQALAVKAIHGLGTIPPDNGDAVE